MFVSRVAWYTKYHVAISVRVAGPSLFNPTCSRNSTTKGADDTTKAQEIIETSKTPIEAEVTKLKQARADVTIATAKVGTTQAEA